MEWIADDKAVSAARLFAHGWPRMAAAGWSAAVFSATTSTASNLCRWRGLWTSSARCHRNVTELHRNGLLQLFSEHSIEAPGSGGAFRLPGRSQSRPVQAASAGERAVGGNMARRRHAGGSNLRARSPCGRWAQSQWSQLSSGLTSSKATTRGWTTQDWCRQLQKEHSKRALSPLTG